MKITSDIHCHTHLSSCADETATIDWYIRYAQKHGLKMIGISDHTWDEKIPFAESMRHSRQAGDGENVLNWYRGQFLPHCREILPEIEQADTQGIRFCFGGEVDYCPGVGAAITMEEAKKLDYMIVPNSHTHHIMDKSLYEPYRKHAEFMLNATWEILNAPTAKYVTSLAHPFDAVCCPYDKDFVWETLTDAELIEVFSAAAEKHIGAEINGSCFVYSSEGKKTLLPPEKIRNHGMTRILSLAKEAGCKFTFGSDSHSVSHEIRLAAAQAAADVLELTEEDIHPFCKV